MIRQLADHFSEQTDSAVVGMGHGAGSREQGAWANGFIIYDRSLLPTAYCLLPTLDTPSL